MKVYYILPSYLYIHEKDKPRVAVFDKDKGWTSEHIDELKFDTEKKQLTFNTNRLAPIAYIQERCTDYPYQSFKLRCIEDDKAILDIQGSFTFLAYMFIILIYCYKKQYNICL